jgi:hypothetical protein|tara:strand:- start:532 stop:690 length:159 start_codon:yes stop_codon:yes gene_type:complete
MMGSWIDSPLFMGLLEDNYTYEIKERKEKKNAETKNMPNMQSEIRYNEMAKK